MASFPFHEVFPSIDFESIPGYPNKFKGKWSENFPTFKGLFVTHVVKFLDYIRGMGEHEDIQIIRFICSLPFDVQEWIKYCCNPKAIYSLIDLISRFLDYGNPQSQTYEGTLQELIAALEEYGFFIGHLIEDLREAHHAQEEDSIGSIHPHDEDNTLIVAPLVEDEEICEEPK
jgi:hypothetical protein